MKELLRAVKDYRDAYDRSRFARGRGKRYAADVRLFHAREHLNSLTNGTNIVRAEQIAIRYSKAIRFEHKGEW